MSLKFLIQLIITLTVTLPFTIADILNLFNQPQPKIWIQITLLFLAYWGLGDSLCFLLTNKHTFQLAIHQITGSPL